MLGLEFEEDMPLPRKYRNVKTSFKRHIEADEHKSSVTNTEKQKQIDQKLSSRNYKAGMAIGRTCYLLYKHGRPFTDFEQMMYLQSVNGVDLGEINHSVQFVRGFLPFVATKVKSNLNKFLSTRLPQTGHRPALNVLADKATLKHRTKQFVGVAMVVPDAENLVQVALLGHPIVKGHHGVDIVDNIKHTLDSRHIVGEQLEGGSTDGQYFHLGVPEAFEKLYGIADGSLHWSWDALHRTGLVDSWLMKEDDFNWIIDVLDVCVSVYKLFNGGQNYEKLVDECTKFKQRLTNLAKTCETRFANSKRLVFINLIKDLGSVISCLQNVQMEAIAGDAKKRQKGSDAAALSSSILNVKFLLCLTGLANIYSQYGILVNKVQEVNLLPHERLEEFESTNAKLKKMADCVENCNLCPVKDNKKICNWPDFHAAVATWKEENKICSLVVPDQYEERASIGANTARSVSRNTSQQSQQNVVESATYKRTETVYRAAV